MTPSITDSWLPARPRAIALVLHGGAEHGTDPLDGRSLPWRRGRTLARHLAAAVTRDDIGVLLLRYRVKGWNAGHDAVPPPVADARWALDEIARTHDLPVAVLGHSMGARTGVAVADHPSMRGVVALAPWLPPDDPVAPLTGKLLRAAHGRRDRITSPRATRAFVARAAAVADAEFTDMGAVGHYLLRRMALWDAYAAASVREVLAPG
ncbi:serine aminopeptidase domain-containing protein [Nocardioides nitrophenolicus]|uniref:serine aminopeptidase domain-containing protein n=1 Tax=Nocardioides nitrophenolicus TaxID=60489 RepID=UPI00195AA1B9|nr:alpha/beta hydrolase [Nocardioides nitrophenolicus]MBM7515596.1 alpha-beta hydrolase superfamily lysophospholipase [Nocardioides nitrophenolicus]